MIRLDPTSLLATPLLTTPLLTTDRAAPHPAFDTPCRVWRHPAPEAP